MKRLTYSLGAKITAVILFFFILTATIICALAALIMLNRGYYQPGSEFTHAYSAYFSLRYLVIVLAFIGAAACASLLAFLICAAGRRPGVDKAVPNAMDNIPLELYAAAVLFIPYILFQFGMVQTIPAVLFMSAALSLSGMMLLAFIMTCATRIKAGVIWRTTFIYLAVRAIAALGTIFLSAMRRLPLVWKYAAAFLCYAVIGLALMSMRLYWLYAALVLCALIFIINLLAQLDVLKKSGELLADGNLNYKTDTSRLLWDLKLHGDNFNRIGDGMAKAVDERMRSERFRAELITNVSHDLKTPLTSIISYIDLLKSRNVQDEPAREYVAVLERQAIRLKKLTEDLVELSKATTGNITVKLEPSSLREIVSQSIEEYAERLKKTGLYIVTNFPENDVVIMADGRLLWRVFDNILSNILKYSMPGTRVYIDASVKEGEAIIAFKNISSAPLNLPAQELMERFTRGDASRSTDGSGLGLSIAQSLTELQNGSFSIATDGDLFRAQIRLKLA